MLGQVGRRSERRRIAPPATRGRRPGYKRPPWRTSRHPFPRSLPMCSSPASCARPRNIVQSAAMTTLLQPRRLRHQVDSATPARRAFSLAGWWQHRVTGAQLTLRSRDRSRHSPSSIGAAEASVGLIDQAQGTQDLLAGFVDIVVVRPWTATGLGIADCLGLPSHRREPVYRPPLVRPDAYSRC